MITLKKVIMQLTNAVHAIDSIETIHPLVRHENDLTDATKAFKLYVEALKGDCKASAESRFLELLFYLTVLRKWQASTIWDRKKQKTMEQLND